MPSHETAVEQHWKSFEMTPEPRRAKSEAPRVLDESDPELCQRFVILARSVRLGEVMDLGRNVTPSLLGW